MKHTGIKAKGRKQYQKKYDSLPYVKAKKKVYMKTYAKTYKGGLKKRPVRIEGKVVRVL